MRVTRYTLDLLSNFTRVRVPAVLSAGVERSFKWQHPQVWMPRYRVVRLHSYFQLHSSLLSVVSAGLECALRPSALGVVVRVLGT